MSAFKRYKSIYGAEPVKLKESQKRLKEKTLKRIKAILREAADEVGTSQDVVTSAIKKINDIVVDVVKSDSVNNPAISTLSDAAAELEAQTSMQTDIEDMMFESEEEVDDSEEDEDDSDEEMEEAILRYSEEEDEEESEEKDGDSEEMEESDEDEEDEELKEEYDEYSDEDEEYDEYDMYESEEGDSNTDADSTDNMGIGSGSQIEVEASYDDNDE